MLKQIKKKFLGFIAILFVISLVATSCSEDGDTL